MTWLNTASRVLSFALVLPLILQRFDPTDIALYYLFTSVIWLQLMTGSGFIPTFARFVSYVLAGCSQADLERLRLGGSSGAVAGPADPTLFAELIGTIRRVFLVLSVGTLPLVAVGGTLFLVDPITQSANPFSAWVAWGLILLVTPFALYASQFSALLQGANKIALEQRWSAVFLLGSALAGCIALLCGGGLLSLIVINQLAQLATYFRLSWLAHRTLKELPYRMSADSYSRAVFKVIWPGSWKTLVGGFSTSGITALSGLVFAQFIPAVQLAQFLFGIRIIGITTDIARAPINSKLPVLNTLRIQHDMDSFTRIAHRGMRLGYAAFLLLFVSAPIGAHFVLPLIQSKIAFPTILFWLALGAATLIERFGAMHLNLYSTSNVIIWHWLNGIMGAVWVLLMIGTSSWLGLYSYPISMFVAYACVYTPIAVRRSLGSIGWTFWQFERTCFVPAALVFVGSSILLLFVIK